ncbi:hypothetical protein BDQ12DRAFT_645406 [Crucibulum laeve]|uniref:Exocyst complex component EXO84 n=1 Tax=Crucibulum laeve TaxID=68775 RepID=A0A5C3MLI4_9AGAR|nr:hypothetical protein BDQ12DRAFT_645406 [Crucibulum laeve]
MDSSLRTRPSQAPRKGRSPTKLAKQGAGPIPRDKSKSRVDDKIKKRMSMRYAEMISSPTELQHVPAMPSISGMLPAGPRAAAMLHEGDEGVRDSEAARDQAKALGDDKKLLSSDDFDADAFLKLKLANSTEAELQSLQSSLQHVKEDTASELQRSVFKNYAEFVLISKEISVLENEMLELKELLSDYKSMPSVLHIPDPTSMSSATISTYKRSSVADLRILYLNQMHSLHAAIEGAAKFVPTTPGRHIVGEMEGVLSLNAATYKVVGKVKFVILDDALLVAKRRRRNMGGGETSGSTVNEGKLVAERCWPLNEMLVLDTKDSPTMTNVFKIRHGKETHVYRTEIAADKKTLLAQFRQVAEELAAKKRKEREGEHERRKSMWQGGGGDRSSAAAPPLPEWMVDLARKGGDIPGTGVDEKEKVERDTRWIGEWADNLTVAIALREWSKAVDLVEKGQARLPTTPALAPKLSALTSQLTSSLLASLALPSNHKSTVVSLISLLSRLKAGSAARNTFLEMRTQVIRSLTRKIRFEGDITAYVGDLTVVYFTGIKHTADWYLASFKENEVASSFISWAKKQVESYAETFRMQVYSKDVDPQLVQETIKITHTQSRKLLQEFGLDFRFLLDALLVEHPKESGLTKQAFSFQEHRISRQFEPASANAVKAKLAEMLSPQLPSAPPPPALSAPPPSRRRSPAPTPAHAPSAPSALNSNSLHPPPSAGLYPPSSSGIRSGNSVTSANTPQSAASVYTNDTQYSTTPGPSARAPYTSQYPASAIVRSRTPLGQSTTPSSAPAPAAPVASPLPRRARSPPMSANPLRPPTAPGARDRERFEERPRDRPPPRSARASPVPRSPAPPPRSANRPGSSAGQRPPIAVPSREGMI